MRPLLLTAFFASLFFTDAFAQDYRDGFVITNAADTVYGLIRYRGTRANAKEIQFKKDQKSELQIYTPSDVKAYRFINGKYYISHSLDTVTKETIFLEYLIDGTVDVYYYRDNKGEHYLIDGGNNQIIELKTGDVVTVVNGQRYTRKNKSYVGVLKVVFAKSPKVSQKVENLSISHKSLIDIAKNYHNEVCSNETCIVYEKNLPRVSYSWGPVVSYNSYSVINHGGVFPDNLAYLTNTKTNSINYPTFGLFFRRNIPLLNEKLFFLLETTIGKRSLEMNSNTNYNNTSFTYYIYNMKYSHLSLVNSLVFRYEFGNGAIKPVLQAGVVADLAFQKKFSRDVVHRVGSTYYPEGTSTENPFSGFDSGFVVGSGLAVKLFKTKEVLLDIKYYKGSGGYVSNFSSRNISISLKYPL